jgi:hypothetical protein
MEIEKRLLEVTGTQNVDDAFKAIERLGGTLMEQNNFIANMSLLSFIIGPQGLAFFMPSPGLITSIEGLAMVDKALSDFAGILAQQRQLVYQQATQNKQPDKAVKSKNKEVK